MQTRNITQQRRTVHPGTRQTLWILVKNRMLLELKKPIRLVARTLFPGLYIFVVIGIVFGQQHSSNARNSGVEVVTFPDPQSLLWSYPQPQGVPLYDSPTPAASAADTLTVIPKHNSVLIGGSSNLSRFTEELVRLPNGISSVEWNILQETISETEFREECKRLSNSSGAKSYCAYIQSTSPAWNYVMYIPGDSNSPRPDEPSTYRSYLYDLYESVEWFHSRIDHAILKVENTTVVAQPTRFTHPLPIPLLVEDTAPWYWVITGLYFLIGLHSVASFVLTPMIHANLSGTSRTYMLLGVPSSVYWYSWSLLYSILGLWTALAAAVVVYFAGLLPLSNPVFVFFSYALAYAQLMLQYVLYVKVMTSEKQANGPFLTVLLSGGINLGLEYIGAPRMVFMLLIILDPNFAFFAIFALYSKWDFAGENLGVTGSQLWESGIGLAYVCQLLGILFYMGLVYKVWTPNSRKQQINNEEQQREKPQEVKQNELLIEGLRDKDLDNVVLDIKNVHKSFKEKCVLNGFNLKLLKNEILGFLGANGSGKSTTCAMTVGEIYPDSGEIEFRFRNGETFRIGEGNDSHIRSRIGYCAQQDNLLEDMSCREILLLFAKLKGGILIRPDMTETESVQAEVRDRINELQFDAITDVDKPIRTYSGGMKRKVAIAVALLGDPEIVFLDEPTAGIDPANRRIVWEMIERAKEGRSIILTSHQMDEADFLSDRIAILNEGRMVACGSSLFLKSKVGVGYSIEFTGAPKATSKSGMCKGFNLGASFPETSLRSEVWANTEHTAVRSTWYLPTDSSRKMSSILRELHRVRCTEIRTNLASLEQVFLEIGANEGEGVSLINQVEKLMGKDTKDLHQENNENDIDTQTEQLIEQVWNPKSIDRKSIGNWQRTLQLTKFTVGMSLYDLSYMFMAVVGPSLILIAALVVAGLASDGSSEKVVPDSDPIQLDADLFLSQQAGVEQHDTVTVFGLPQAMLASGSFGTVNFVDQMPSNVSDFVNTTSGALPFLGGVRYENSSTFYNGSSQFSPGIIQALLTNYSLQLGASGAPAAAVPSVDTSLVYLSYVEEPPFNGLAFALPLLMVFSTYGLTHVLMSAVEQKEKGWTTLYQTLGVSLKMTYASISIKALLLSFFPQIIISVILGVALQIPYAGGSGRFLVFLVASFAYAFAVIPFCLLFAPLFNKLEQAASVFPALFVIGIVIPYTAINTLTLVLGQNESSLKALEIANYMCQAYPPFAYQLAITRVLQLSPYYDAENLTWATVWGWKTGAGQPVCLLIGTGLIFWMAAVYQVQSTSRILDSAAEKSPSKVLSDTVIPISVETYGLKLETERAYRNAEGINLRGVSKTFRVRSSGSSSCCCKQEKISNLVSDNVTFCVKPGDTNVLLGPNGAGKTTLMRQILREVALDRGSIALAGYDHCRDKEFQQLTRDGLLGYAPQFNTLVPMFTVGKHLEFVCSMRGLDLKHNSNVKAHVSAIVRLLRLSQYYDTKTKQLSGGYKRKVGLAMALIGHPKLILADEMSTGIDPSARSDIHQIFIRGKEQWDASGSTEYSMPATMISTHVMDEATSLANKVTIMISGKVIAVGSVPQLIEWLCDSIVVELSPPKLQETGFAFNNGELLEKTIELLESRDHQVTISPNSSEGRIRLQIAFQTPDVKGSDVVQRAEIMDILESNKTTLGWEYYNVNLLSLEEIFVRLVAKNKAQSVL